MKLKNFKMLSFILAGFAILALSGCNSSSGTSSDIGIVDAEESTVTASPISIAADGTARSTVTVTIKDENANLITDATVTLAQTGSSTIGAVTNNGDGTYTFDVTSTTVETVTYTATADTVAITQTADVTFTEVTPPVPDAGTSTVTANLGSVLADGTETSTATVTVKDALSNPITDAAVSLAQTGSSTIGAVTNNGDGTYTFDVTSTTVETVTYTATADTVAITQTTDVTFTAVPPPMPDATESNVTASPASVPADGTTTSTVTVTVKDELSNPITSAAVSLDQGAGGSSTISLVDTSNAGAGIYTFDVNSTTVETVTYTATADTVVITQTVDVNFTETEAQCLLAAGYGTVDINSRIWLDKNLGATQAATDPTDADAYGDYYQWGRSAEGHQESIDTNDTLATSVNGNDVNTDWYGKFIVNDTAAPNDWVDGIDNNGSKRSQSWSAPYDETTNPNQVCPCGYVVPTQQDFIDLDITANAGAFMPAYAGWRWYNSGVIQGEATSGLYWTSDTKANGGSISYYLNTVGVADDDRAYGLSVRCIKP